MRRLNNKGFGQLVFSVLEGPKFKPLSVDDIL